MRNADLGNALHHLGVIQDLLAEHDGAANRPNVLGALQLLSGSITRFIPDCLCHQKLGELRTFARALYSDSEHRRWGRSPLTGSQHLRLQILKTLNELGARIRALYKIRSNRAGDNVVRLFGDEAQSRRQRARAQRRSAR